MPLLLNTRRYIYAARELSFVATHSLSGHDLEAQRDWKYIAENGLTSIFYGYALSLDMYVRFCWTELGKMGSLMIGLLVAEVGDRMPLVLPCCWCQGVLGL
jgi:hypothetical protein